MRLANLTAGALATAALIVAPAYAGQRGNSGAHAPSPAPKAPTTVTHGASSSGSHGPSTTSTTTHGQSATAHGAGATTSGGSTTSNAKTSSGTTSTGDASSTSTTTSSGTTTTSTVDFTSGKAGRLLTKNPALQSKLETRLQALGYQGTVYEAAYGFKNLGQFVAATNVAQNLGISFEKLKLQMTGLSVSKDGTVLEANMLPDGTIKMVAPADATSPAPTKSLGQSIQTLKSGVDATTTAQTATKAADAEIASTSSTSTTTAPSTSSTTTSSTTTTGSTTPTKTRKKSSASH